MMNHQYHLKNIGLFLLLFSTNILAANTVPKLVYLIVDEDKLIASNIEFNRFDEVNLIAKEEIVESAVGNAVIVVVTNKRIMAYSVYKLGWVIKNTGASETVEAVSAEDYSGLVITSKRYLSFNGKTGLWTENPRQKVFD